jgi:ubiquinone/menaquinone biosynthesis C-methylase UbiE
MPKTDRLAWETVLVGHETCASKLAEWGLQQVSVGEGDTILDVGCGGGAMVRKLAAVAAEGKVFGVDHSEQSVAAARRTDRQGIAEGRVEIRQASVSALPFPDGLFDLVTAVETHYFWTDMPADMREILRVLKLGGKLVVLAEACKGGKHDQWLQKVAKLTKMAFLTAEEHRELFSNAPQELLWLATTRDVLAYGA